MLHSQELEAGLPAGRATKPVTEQDPRTVNLKINNLIRSGHRSVCQDQDTFRASLPGDTPLYALWYKIAGKLFEPGNQLCFRI